jgi:RNA polymerase sigma-70 factor (ECF subfamily)
VFNEGYAATGGETLTRVDLSSEAIRLMRLLRTLLPQPQAVGEIKGLLALMLLNESRRAARLTAAGDVILLEDQDRSLWNREYISEGLVLTREVFESRQIGPYAVQAAISAMHAQAASAAVTDWAEIAGLYDLLLNLMPSPVVELNRAVAVAMRDGFQAGLTLVDALLARGELADYRLAHAARADLCRRLGRMEESRVSYQRALALTQLVPERRFFEQRLAAL